MPFTLTDLLLVVLGISTSIILRARRAHKLRNPQNLPKPPGPEPRWIVGNLRDIPGDYGWLTFSDWAKKYGDVVYAEALGSSILVLNSLDAVNDLLERRGQNYSRRPVLTVAGELLTFENGLGLNSDNPRWRRQRKMCNVILSQSASKQFYEIQEQGTLVFLQNLLDKPEAFDAALRLVTGKIAMAVTYGLPMHSADDKYIQNAEEFLEVFSNTAVPGKYLVDFLPFLKHIYPYFPFLPFYKEVENSRRIVFRSLNLPFEHVQSEMRKGAAPPSFTSQLLEEIEAGEADYGTPKDEVIEDLKYLSMAMYGAAGETTYSTILTFFLAMIQYPEVQARAQAEIDNLMGREGRLPRMNDRDHLPYVNAVVKEAHRWHIAVPLGLPHRSAEDDVYRGYFIPAGTTIIPNIWYISHDPRHVDRPDEFIPERFLDPESGAVDPTAYVFGFGRRICPGRYLADNSVFILIASILATFTVSPAVEIDAMGNQKEVPIKPQWTSGVVSFARDFRCSFTPRSPMVRELLGKRLA